MTLTLTLTDAPAIPAPDAPVRIDAAATAALSRALHAIICGGPDIDGTPLSSEGLWLSYLAPDTVDLALLNLTGNADPQGAGLTEGVSRFVRYAHSAQLLIDVIRRGPDGAELQISDDDGPVEPREWTYGRMRAALSLAGLDGRAQVHAGEPIMAAARIRDAQIETRPARDVQRLGALGESLVLWNDVPELVCRALGADHPAGSSETPAR